MCPDFAVVDDVAENVCSFQSPENEHRPVNELVQSPHSPSQINFFHFFPGFLSLYFQRVDTSEVKFYFLRIVASKEPLKPALVVCGLRVHGVHRRTGYSYDTALFWDQTIKHVCYNKHVWSVLSHRPSLCVLGVPMCLAFVCL